MREQHPALMACIALVTGILTAGVFLWLLCLWVGIHREPYRTEPAAWVGTEPELPAMGEFESRAPPTANSRSRVQR